MGSLRMSMGREAEENEVHQAVDVLAALASCDPTGPGQYPGLHFNKLF